MTSCRALCLLSRLPGQYKRNIAPQANRDPHIFSQCHIWQNMFQNWKLLGRRSNPILTGCGVLFKAWPILPISPHITEFSSRALKKPVKYQAGEKDGKFHDRSLTKGLIFIRDVVMYEELVQLAPCWLFCLECVKLQQALCQLIAIKTSLLIKAEPLKQFHHLSLPAAATACAGQGTISVVSHNVTDWKLHSAALIKKRMC